MTLSEAISIAIKNEGIAIVGEKKFVNYLSDLCSFDTPALKRIISILVDEKYLVPLADIDTKVDMEFFFKNIGTQLIQKEGFQPHLVNFVIESLFNGTQDKRGTPSLPEKNGKNDLPFFANLYHHFGMNITHIQKTTKKWYKYYDEVVTQDSYKDPTDPEWKRFLELEQDSDYINNQNWNTATGIGVVTGYKQLRALDFDYLDLLEKNINGGERLNIFISKVLNLLGLPGDYPWVTRSGSGYGLHFVFRCKDIDGFNNKVASFVPSPDTKEKGDGFECLELRWSGHLVMPPSHSANYYNEHFRDPRIEHYRFYSCDFPTYAPIEIDFNKINNLLNYFSSTVGSMNFVPSKSKPSEYVHIIGHIKTTTKINSEGDYSDFKPSEQWANSCDNEEAALYYLSKDLCKIKTGNLKKAVELLKKSDTPISHYNMANLIAHGILSGNKKDALGHFAFVQNSKEISQYDIRRLKDDINQME